MMTYWKNIVLPGIKSELLLKKGFASKPMYNKFFLKATIKSYRDKAVGFHDKEVAQAGSNHTCSEVIMIYSAFKKGDNY